MKVLDWNKFTDSKKKRYQKYKTVFLAGSIHLSNKRRQQIFDQLKKYKVDRVIIGYLKDDFINEFEGSEQFRTQKYGDLAQYTIDKHFVLLKYFQRDIEYIIKELQPNDIYLVNGSWYSMFHYRPEYWRGLEYGAKFHFISPFVDEEEGLRFEEKINLLNNKKQYFEDRQYTDRELIDKTNEIKHLSWAWERQTAAILAKEGKVLEYGFNKVLPHQYSQMHKGSLREKMKCASQEHIELHQTLHAEMMVLTEANKKGISFDGCDMFIELFPCGHCAKILANTGLNRIVYQHDHSNSLGYQILKDVGVELVRLV